MAQSPLKVRGYLAQGVPAYGGHPDVFPPDSRVYRRGGADVGQVLDHARAMRPVSREAVRAEAQGHIDKRVLVRRLYVSLTGVTGAAHFERRQQLWIRGSIQGTSPP